MTSSHHEKKLKIIENAMRISVVTDEIICIILAFLQHDILASISNDKANDTEIMSPDSSRVNGRFGIFLIINHGIYFI